MRLSPLLVVTCALVSWGCEAATSPQPPNVAEADSKAAFPELSRSGKIFVEAEPIYSQLHHGATLVSRYVLYDDGTFALQMVSGRFGVFQYQGRYELSGSTIALDFDAENTAGSWRAHGTLERGLLTVEYNIVAWLADFRAGAYILSVTAP